MNITEVLGNVTFQLIDVYGTLSWYLELKDELAIVLHHQLTQDKIAWKISPSYTEENDKHLQLAEIIATRDKKSLAEALCDIGDRILQGKLECVRRLGAIYINRAGGYAPFNEDQIVSTKVGRLNEWPGNPDIRIIQWTDGSHYYVKVNDIDVVIDGEQKWNTKTKAEKALKLWLNMKEEL